MERTQGAADEIVARRREPRSEADQPGRAIGRTVLLCEPARERQYRSRPLAARSEEEAETLGGQLCVRSFAQMFQRAANRLRIPLRRGARAPKNGACELGIHHIADGKAGGQGVAMRVERPVANRPNAGKPCCGFDIGAAFEHRNRLRIARSQSRVRESPEREDSD